jgi:hypothetical protein
VCRGGGDDALACVDLVHDAGLIYKVNTSEGIIITSTQRQPPLTVLWSNHSCTLPPKRYTQPTGAGCGTTGWTTGSDMFAQEQALPSNPSTCKCRSSRTGWSGSPS